MNLLIILFGKLFSFLSKLFNLGHGSTWPGHIALVINPNFIKDVLGKSNLKIILIIGTNGKTTTSKLIQTVLQNNNKTVLLNTSGANLINGVASSLILSGNLLGEIDKDYAILEIDENAFPQIVEKLTPNYIIALNLFRDQLDRYGEVNAISSKWKKVVDKLKSTTLILNADDPEIAFLGENTKNVYFFGLEDKSLQTTKLQHASDSLLCPKCNTKLIFSKYYFSHLGIWECKNCKLKRPTPDIASFKYYPLTGTYAIYDTLAAVSLARLLKIKDDDILLSLKKFKPAFGRQEKIKFNDKNIQIFLGKNPISFNESLETIKNIGGKNILIVLNDNIPDGLDVSWIWDVDFETILGKDMTITVSGTRKFDIALRLKYAGFFTHIADSLEEALVKLTNELDENEKLFILPNYSAMLETRKILTGKKIL